MKQALAFARTYSTTRLRLISINDDDDEVTLVGSGCLFGNHHFFQGNAFMGLIGNGEKHSIADAVKILKGQLKQYSATKHDFVAMINEELEFLNDVNDEGDL